MIKPKNEKNNVRALALEALLKVESKGSWRPKEAAEEYSKALPPRDRAFLKELLMGSIRYKLTLNWIMKKFVKRPGGLGLRTKAIIRLGLYQIFHMRVPDRAAVYESVGLSVGKSALINAVLRSAARAKKEITAELGQMEAFASNPEAEPEQRLEALGITTSHPGLLLEKWANELGLEEAVALARANNIVPPLTLRVNTLKAGRAEVKGMLARQGIGAQETKYSSSGLRLVSGRSFSELSSVSGLVSAQDEAAQLMSAVLAPEPGQRVLDACAAPGGKATHLAELMQDKGEVIAVEVDAMRAEMIRENAERLGLCSVSVVVADARELEGRFPKGHFDKILLDPPCSATGVIRRNPDVKYRQDVRRTKELARTQLSLLQAVSGLLKPGGVMLYCTCSTDPAEGEHVIEEFLKSSRDFYIIKDAPDVITKEASGVAGEMHKDGIVRTYPHRHEMDGFFGVRFCKKE